MPVLILAHWLGIVTKKWGAKLAHWTHHHHHLIEHAHALHLAHAAFA